ncbi:hypothetical protein O3G_MSEX006151 [Manduca sexta]|uniref:Major facilitator superfamily (MFS) profile domain-containing protein n=1 Tax=Manduca sexta TaxID=7130 RepID=A0A922CKX7_MANSE|nr:hypothetical protein O3G_MSEX006151 [Manduca sexta]
MAAGRNQYLCSLIISMPSFLASFGIVWPSYAIEILEGDHTPLSHKINKQEANFIGSFPMLGSFIVTLFIGYVSDWIGRKHSELLCGLFISLAWAIIATAKTSTQLLIGRFIFGFGFGIQFVVALIYTGEMAHPSTTGSATSILMFAFSIGSLSSYLAGWFCSYEAICYFNLSLGVVFVVAISFMKETPAFLIGKGKDKEALKSLKFYRAASTNTEDILEEYNYIKSQRTGNKVEKLEKSQISAENEKLNQEDLNKHEKATSAWKILLTSKPLQRALAFLIVVISLTICMGMMAVQAYAGPFFSMAVPNMSPHLCSVVLAIVLAVSSGVAAAITDMFRRRVNKMARTATFL